MVNPILGLISLWQAVSVRAIAAGTDEAAHLHHADGAGEPFDAGSPETLFGFFERLFGVDFIPHGHCFFWKPAIIWLHVFSDAFIALSYFAIPVLLIHFIRKRRDIPFNRIFYLFGSFILLCGLTHVLNIVTFWYPMYRFDGLAKALTALVSVGTAIALLPLLPKALALKSPQELERKNEELRAAYAKIKESEKMKDEFLARVSHELRTPLTLIVSPLDSLLLEKHPATTPGQMAHLRTIHNNANRLLQIINGLLDFSKVESGKLVAARETTPLVALTQSVVTDFKFIFASRRIELSFTPPAEELWVEIDRFLYERILFNLLSNASKFTEPQGRVVVSLAHADGKIRLSVKDNGIGIPVDDISRLFERFAQLDEASTRRFEGTGLGLSLVRDFAGLLGGTVSVHSEVGQGSDFVVELPANLSDEAKGHPALAQRRSAEIALAQPNFVPSPTTPPADSDKSKDLPAILVAEDNEELAQYISLTLSPIARPLIARDGASAFKLAQSSPVRLVLSDVMMPEMNGLDLCRALKKNAATAHIPVVLLTALTHRDALMSGWEAGADEYLFKPFHPVELLTRVRAMLASLEQRDRISDEQKRREELEQFAYFASHDLREPLRILTNFTQLLEIKVGPRLEPSEKECLNFIVQAATRMGQLIQDLVSYSLISSDKPPLETVNSAAVLAHALENLSLSISDTHATITYGELPEIVAFKAQLVQLFQNLIANGIKFHGEKPPNISISAERIGNAWTFAVRDQGIGFNPEYADRIFVVFQRLHTTSAYPGTGVGLAICKRIVEGWGGKIWAKSEPGQGATFYFTVPIPPA